MSSFWPSNLILLYNKTTPAGNAGVVITGLVAQRIERLTANREVAGSNPAEATREGNSGGRPWGPAERLEVCRGVRASCPPPIPRLSAGKAIPLAHCDRRARAWVILFLALPVLCIIRDYRVTRGYNAHAERSGNGATRSSYRSRLPVMARASKPICSAVS